MFNRKSPYTMEGGMGAMNPVRVGLIKERVLEPQVMVIFGASGDCTIALAAE